MLSLKNREQAKSKYKGQLAPKMTGKTVALFTRILRTLSGKKAVAPGDFSSSKQAKSVTCSQGPNEGLLYPLTKAFFFLPKPVVSIRYAHVTLVKFSMVSRTTTFGIQIHTSGNLNLKKIAKGGVVYFENIPKEEFDALHEFVKAKGMRTETDESAAPAESKPAGEANAEEGNLKMENSEEDSSFSQVESEQDELEYQEGDAIDENDDKGKEEAEGGEKKRKASSEKEAPEKKRKKNSQEDKEDDD